MFQKLAFKLQMLVNNNFVSETLLMLRSIQPDNINVYQASCVAAVILLLSSDIDQN
jgi:hypothetical protein